MNTSKNASKLLPDFNKARLREMCTLRKNPNRAVSNSVNLSPALQNNLHENFIENIKKRPNFARDTTLGRSLGEETLYDMHLKNGGF